MTKKNKDKQAKTPTEPILDAADGDTQAQTVLTASPKDGQDKPAADVARPKKLSKKEYEEELARRTSNSSSCKSGSSTRASRSSSSEPIVLPPRQDDGGYVRPPMTDQTFVPQVF